MKAAYGNPAVTLNYGNFLQFTFAFMIVAFAVFMVIKTMNAAKRRQEAATPATPPAPTKDQVSLTEIIDLLIKYGSK